MVHHPDADTADAVRRMADGILMGLPAEPPGLGRWRLETLDADMQRASALPSDIHVHDIRRLAEGILMGLPPEHPDITRRRRNALVDRPRIGARGRYFDGRVWRWAA